MFDSWQDLADPLGPGGGAWMCIDCAEDGELDQLVDGRCFNCGGEVELT